MLLFLIHVHQSSGAQMKRLLIVNISGKFEVILYMYCKDMAYRVSPGAEGLVPP